MKLIFHSVGKINGGLVAAYGVSVDAQNHPIPSASITLVEPRGGALGELEPGTVYEVTLAAVPAAPAQP